MPEGNPFSDLIPGYTAQAVPPIRQIVPPRPKQPTPKSPTEAAIDNEQLIKIRRENEKAAGLITPQAIAEARLELRNVIDNSYRARELSMQNPFIGHSGVGTALGKIWPNTSSDIAAKLDTIGANLAFEQLQKMREASPTGGALGQITERELDLLKSTVAPITKEQTPEEFQGAMQQIAESYGRVLAKLPGGRAMLIERGWLPKSGSGGKKPPAPKQGAPKVIDFNDLP